MEQGKCPKCGSENLNYETICDITPGDECIYYPFECEGCGFTGREYYNLHFTGYEDNDGNEITEPPIWYAGWDGMIGNNPTATTEKDPVKATEEELGLEEIVGPYTTEAEALEALKESAPSDDYCDFDGGCKHLGETTCANSAPNGCWEKRNPDE